MSSSKSLRVLPLYLGVGSTGLIALVSIPVMIRAGGLDVWSAIGVGQTVGGLVAAVVSYGWGITGPSDIARAAPRERRREYAESLRVRLAIAPAALLAGLVFVWTVTGWDGAALGFVGLASTALTGLSGIFYFLGTGELWKSFFCDSLPRAIGTTLGLVVVVVSDFRLTPALIPLGTIAGISVALLATTIAVNRGLRDPYPLRRRRVGSLLVENRHGLVTSLSTGLSQVAPTLLVGWIAPNALSGYLFYDRLYKQAMTFLSPALNVFQGWVPRGGTHGQRRRMALAIGVSIGAGVTCFIGVATIGPMLVRLLSANEIEPQTVPLIAVGTLIAVSAVDLVVSRVGLVVKGKVGALALASVASLAVSLVAILVLSPIWGLGGALIGTVVGVILRLAYSSFVFARAEWAN